MGVSDALGEIEKTSEYMKEQGMVLNAPVIFQDNMSTITLVTNENSGNVRTRHLNARRAIVYEAAKVRMSVHIKYLKTKDMIADVLTKPLGGGMFYKFANSLMGRTRKLCSGTTDAGATGVR